MLSPENYLIIIQLFPRLLGFVYFFAFGAFLFQMKGLFGKNGILPVARYLHLAKAYYGKKAYRKVPSLFWINASDAALMIVPALGTCFSILLIFGFYPAILLPLLLILYLSILTVGQDFLSFGWESLLMEITYFAILMSLTTTPNLMVWFGVNVLIFRFHFLAGVLKLQASDPNWKNWTAMCYHYQTQPIPNIAAWFVHKFPRWVHKMGTATTLFIEIAAPFLVLGTDEMRLVAFVFLFGLQLMIWMTGNFSYLNYLTAVLVTLLLSDSYLAPLFGSAPLPLPTPLPLDIFLSVIGLCLIIVQLIRIWHQFLAHPLFDKILKWVWPYYLAHWHAIFAHMTTTRYEIIIEGSDDGITWKEYGFWYKPSELNRRPRRIAPYQPRIDWQMWFLPFTYYEQADWFQSFLEKLLAGSPHVLKLIRHNPFPNKPPRHIRSLTYIYEYNDIKTKNATGNWWKRTLVGNYSPIISHYSNPEEYP